jgi:hypothetical protein
MEIRSIGRFWIRGKPPWCSINNESWYQFSCLKKFPQIPPDFPLTKGGDRPLPNLFVRQALFF